MNRGQCFRVPDLSLGKRFTVSVPMIGVVCPDVARLSEIECVLIFVGDSDEVLTHGENDPFRTV